MANGDRLSSKAKRRLKELESRSEVAETSLGAVEYAIVGEGYPILAFHGGPGGFDQSLWAFDMLAEAGFQVICPSRPGYLRTPISTGRTYSEQARAMAALLDELGIDRVGVIGASAGGPPSYTFARLFPERTAALVEVDSICMTYDVPEQAGKIQQALYLTDTGMALTMWMARHMSGSAIKGVISTEGHLTKEEVKERVSHVMEDERKVQWLTGFFNSMYPYSARKDGVDNDVEQGRAMGKLPLNEIKVPTLIIHGDSDADAEFYHGQYAAESIPGAEHIWVKGGTHFCFWASDEAYDVQNETIEFLRKHSV